MTRRERLARLYRERRAEGLCADCGSIEVRYARCRECRVKRAARQLAYTRKRAA